MVAKKVIEEEEVLLAGMLWYHPWYADTSLK